ncbi:outer membrane protein assembly factor BamE [Chitinolyticbacter meiyuanensis]|uniref:outer membrane protein assembly factor BamE n=1 Tax=Chitinolyticbacter meiyuanensis TaxID=682798 RepID=UPI0011E5A2A6|nr:outer membrane protein assembly factor BamE [Chitinolyticbacter meiyuanensis]
MHIIKPTLLSLALAALLAGCGTLNAVPHYKLDIPQGNEVTADKADQLKVGMTRSQVRFLLGTPLLNDPFHADRWDYVYSDAKGGKLQQKKALSIFFDGDSVARWQGDTLPAVADQRAIKLAPDQKKDDTMSSEINPGAAGTGKDVEVKPLLDKEF